MNPDDVADLPLVLDTDVASWLSWRRPQGQPFIPLIEGHILVLSFATVAELWYGAEAARWGDTRRAELDRILHRYVVVPGTAAVARHFGRIKAAFVDQFDERDMWIAATALAQQQPLPVVTNNLRHFTPISKRFGLLLVHPDL